MANYKLLKRLSCIMHLLTHKRGISKTEMLNRLYMDFDIDTTSRTLERDLKNLKDDFGIEMNYSRSIRGYVIEENDEYINRFLKFAEFSSLAEVYDEGFKNYKSFDKYVLKDDSLEFTGLHNMARILKAITLSRKLKFTKENYTNETIKTYTVSPLRLKEYLNRWYLIAVPNGIDEIRSFGLDRITDLQLLDEKATIKDSFEDQIKQYDDVIGLNFNETKKVEKVVLEVDNNQLKYLKSLPLHKSQVCIDGEKGTPSLAIYKVKPNYEFETQILRMGDTVEVIEPLWLRKKIKERLTKTIERYS
ncbi:helix-turn-helix transcriptional regulator [Tenacibaculum aquimarinum]|uniref:helix-turn-helix transcriptional regulator n=1 Tax=Tenacibaculum aquimarinum TaxID=2910675 RepID=UPI001F0A4C8C|nr:WYL domain-containing protein [Tenacibaculum aquimarinum]MCH3884515.1 WYL domain-containing protein [Tenacibaculum aquimarinum]